MKKFLRLISLALILCTLVSALAACKNTNDDEDQSGDTKGDIDISQYTIVRSEDAKYSLCEYVTTFQKLIKEYSGAELAVTDDYIEDENSFDKNAKEILIGSTNRDESIAANEILASAPKEGAYIIIATENKIVIAGKSEAATVRAMKKFLVNNVDAAGGSNIKMEIGHKENGVVDTKSQMFDNFTEMITEVSLDLAKPNFTSGASYSYESMIKLAHNGEANGMLIATHATLYGSENGYKMYRSYDDGNTWEQYANAIDTITPALSDSNMQPCLFELPAKTGEFAEGTLFLAGCSRSENGDKSNIILYYSTDLGVSWKSYKNIAIGGRADTKEGVWEPFLMYEEDTGRVYCFYSDETEPKNGAKAQKLVYKYSTDMQNWSELKTVISCTKPDCRPGMISIAKLGNGEYYMTYEMIGYETRSPAYAKRATSLDDWGDPADYGTLIKTGDNKTIGSAPWCAWTPVGGDRGMLLVVARWMSSGTPIHDANNDGSGSDMLVSFDYGKTFMAIKNPIQYEQIKNSDKAKCGYSAFIGFSEDGHTLYYFNSVTHVADLAKVVFKRIKVW